MITALIIIGSVIVLFFLLALIMSKEMNVERTITINKPVHEVFEYIRFVKNHDHFNAWMRMDPEMKKEYRGTDGTVGFAYVWDSVKNKGAGAGEQETKIIRPDESIELELRFIRPMQDVAKAKMITQAVGPNQTQVQWGFYSTMKFPMNVMKPMVEGMMVKSLEDSLRNLKNVLEK
jgi:hypothetical protein